MSRWFRWGVLSLMAGLIFGVSENAMAGWPTADQLPAVRKLAQQLVTQANSLNAAIKKEWPGDKEFIERVGKFANRCQHLVNITSVAIDKDENGRHTQSAYGEIHETWNAVKACPSMRRIEDWKQRHEIHNILVKLEPYYR